MRIVRFDTLQPFQAINLTSDPGAIPGVVHIPSCAQISILFDLVNGKRTRVVLVGRYAGAFHGTVAECNTILAGLVAGASWTALAPFLATQTTLVGVQIRDVNPTDGSGVLLTSTNAGAPGTSTGIALPGEVAAVVTKRTALAGQQNRGRAYVPGFATNALGASDLISAATVTALQNWAVNNWGSSLGNAGYTHVLGQPARAAYTSPATGRQFPARPAGSQVVTQVLVRDNHWDTQRRRGFK